MAEHRAKKKEMMEKEEKNHFSYKLRATQTDDEKEANKKLQEMKNGFITPFYNIVIHDFY